ncbi:MAG: hypothetical protein FJW69_05980 [Actinobacteria bacterium]|nr:hypothetical protein [Actinomycetota bacterium]
MKNIKRTIKISSVFFIIISLIFLISTGSLSCKKTSEIPSEVLQFSKDWPVSNKNYANTRETLDSDINLSNVATLDIAWEFPIPGIGEWGAATTNPLILGDKVYLQDLKSNVYSIDIATGNLNWKKEYNLDAYGPNGPAVGWNKIFVQKGHFEIAALDLKGNELWSTKLSDKETVGIDIQLTAFGNLVYASTVPGTENANFYTGGGVGIIYALDQKTGKVKWSFNTVDSEDIWGNPEVNSGGGVWFPPAIDTENKIAYFGIGNPAPWPGTEEFPNGSSRPGDNLYTNSIVALDAKTGKLLWYNQVLPHDLFDLDFQNSPVLTTLTVDGKSVDAVIGSGKLGKVYAFETSDGKIIWETSVGIHENDELKELPEGTTRVYPGPLGGVETCIALSDEILYIPVVNLFADYTPESMDVSTFDIGAGTGELVALDLKNGKEIWKREFNSINIGAATVVNDLVFTSIFDGMIYAFDKKTGNEAWKYQAPGGINGWPAVSNDMILFPVGLGPEPKLLAFKLGKASSTAASQQPTDSSESAATGSELITSEFKADGVISEGEYSGKQTYGDFEINWTNDDTYFYAAIKAEATGFVAVAIQPGSRMKNADIIMGFVKDGSASIFDMFSTGDFGPHMPDTELGGTDDVIEYAAAEDGTFTIIEFKRLLVTGDDYDNDIVEGKNQIIWAYSKADDLEIKHSTRGYGEIEISIP